MFQTNTGLSKPSFEQLAQVISKCIFTVSALKGNAMIIIKCIADHK